MLKPSIRRLVLGTLAATLLLGGCATIAEDSGFKTIVGIAHERFGRNAIWQCSPEARNNAVQRTRELLAQPLIMDRTVQTVLLNDRGLQASYAELGLPEAMLVQTSRLPNPGFSFRRTCSGDDLSTEHTFSLSFLNLLMLPVATRIEDRYFGQIRPPVASQMLRVAVEACRVYASAVAAKQSAHYAKRVQQAVKAGAEFVKRLASTDNLSKLDCVRGHAFYIEATATLMRACQQTQAECKTLIRLLGMWGMDTGFQLLEYLPDLPKDRPELRQIEAYTLRNRLDIQAGKLQVGGLVSSLGLTQTIYFINVPGLDYVHNSKSNEPCKMGYEIGIEIPLFGQSGVHVAHAWSIYMRATDQLADTVVRARSEVHESCVRYQIVYDLTYHYHDEFVPAYKRIPDRMLLRYSDMLASVFELLANAREQMSAVDDYVGAPRGYWVAQTNLQMALSDKLPITKASAATTASNPPRGR